MRRIVALLALGAFVLTSGLAYAQGGYVKKKVFDFEGDDIEGSLLSPSGDFLGGDLNPDFKTLIKYRYDFVPEMIKSAEDI